MQKVIVRPDRSAGDHEFYMTKKEIDPRYLCVCVEQINYTPISFDDVLKMT
jgi:hypothetical protein